MLSLKKGNAQTSKKSESTIDSQVVQDCRTRLFSDSRLPWMFLLIDSTHWKGWCPTFFCLWRKKYGKKYKKSPYVHRGIPKNKQTPGVFCWSQQKNWRQWWSWTLFSDLPFNGFFAPELTARRRDAPGRMVAAVLGGSLVVVSQPHLANETPGMGENVFKKIETTLVSQGCLGMVTWSKLMTQKLSVDE